MRIFLLMITGLSVLLFNVNSFAKNLNLYDKPAADAKLIATIADDTSIIPIFTPKEQPDWIKIADPNNGNVGWLKLSELGVNNKNLQGLQFQQRAFTSKSPGSYSIVQYYGPQRLTPAELQDMVKKMEQQQQDIQRSIQKNMQDMQAILHQPMPWPASPTQQAEKK